MKKILLVIFLILFSFSAGFFIGFKNKKSERIEIIKQGEIKYIPIYRDMEKLTLKEKENILIHYSNDKPFLNIYQIDNNTVIGKAGLYDRTWEQTFKIKIKENPHYKLYAGLLVGGIVAGVLIGVFNR